MKEHKFTWGVLAPVIGSIFFTHLIWTWFWYQFEISSNSVWLINVKGYLFA